MPDTVPHCVNSSNIHLMQYDYRQICDIALSLKVYFKAEKNSSPE